jgi:opacity protein-like surface antigen
MGSFKLYATLAGLLAVASSTAVRAADLLPPPPPLEAPPLEVGGGWYLRGDVGVSNYDGAKFKNAETPDATYSGENFGSGAFAGAGVGYQFNNWFRADVTGEYRFSTGIRVNDHSFFYSNGYGINGYESTKGDYSGAVVLVNGYFDLGTWYGITPFVGAGVGWGHTKLDGWSTSTVNAYTDKSIGAAVSGGTIRDKSSDHLAWALHAGLGYDVSPNLKLELAYRYLNLGDARTGNIDCYCGETYSGLKVKDLQSHDIKIGMRWMLGGPVAAPMPVEPYGAPIIRKY